jgi:hypothetical protein
VRLLVAFTSVAASMVFDYPGFQRPTIALLSAADAAVQADLGVVDAFGQGAMMTRGKLDAANAGRPHDQQRSIADCLAPFDIDAAGTMVGNAGTATMVTTLVRAAFFRHHGDRRRLGSERRNAAKGTCRRLGGEKIIQAFEMAYQVMVAADVRHCRTPPVPIRTRRVS